MRAAHSLKGAARIVGRNAAVQVAHSMEDCIVAVQNRKLILSDRHVDAMLAGVDLLGRIAQVPEQDLESWSAEHQTEMDAFLASLSLDVGLAVGTAPTTNPQSASLHARDVPAVIRPNTPDIALQTSVLAPPPAEFSPKSSGAAERVLRVTTDNLNRLLARYFCQGNVADEATSAGTRSKPGRLEGVFGGSCNEQTICGALE